MQCMPRLFHPTRVQPLPPAPRVFPVGAAVASRIGTSSRTCTSFFIGHPREDLLQGVPGRRDLSSVPPQTLSYRFQDRSFEIRRNHPRGWTSPRRGAGAPVPVFRGILSGGDIFRRQTARLRRGHTSRQGSRSMAAIQRRAGLLGIGLASALLLGWGIVIAAAAAASPAGPVHLVHDFSPGEFEGDRPLPQLTRLGETLFFVAAEPETGSTLWRTDGTVAGSRRVLVAGDPGIFDDPKVLGTVGGRIFWTARSEAYPNLRVLLAAGESGDAVVLTTCFYDAKPLGQRLFFLTCTAPGLWSTDGTVAGTRLVPGLAGHADRSLTLEKLADRW